MLVSLFPARAAGARRRHDAGRGPLCRAGRRHARCRPHRRRRGRRPGRTRRFGGRSGATLLGLAVLLWSGLRVFRGLDVAFSLVYGHGRRDSFANQPGRAGRAGGDRRRGRRGRGRHRAGRPLRRGGRGPPRAGRPRGDAHRGVSPAVRDLPRRGRFSPRRAPGDAHRGGRVGAARVGVHGVRRSRRQRGPVRRDRRGPVARDVVLRRQPPPVAGCGRQRDAHRRTWTGPALTTGSRSY